MSETLMCRVCGLTKPVEDFAPSHCRGTTGTCRPCNTERAKEYRHLKSNAVNDQLALSEFNCLVCSQLKPMTEFRWNSRTGYKTECKKCEETILRCSNCKNLKSHDLFPPSKRMVTGRHSFCKDCHNKRMTEKYATNPEHRKRQKQYSQSDKAKAWRKKHWQETKEQQREYHKSYYNWKYHNDPIERNKIEARAAVNFGVKFGFIKKPDMCQSEGDYGVSCSDSKLSAHHHKGYDKENWLEVRWLCSACHAEADKIQREENNQQELT